MELDVRNATSSPDVSNSGEDAQSTETSKRSDRKYKLLCNPSNLPKPPLPATKETSEAGKPKYILNIIKDYFYHAKMRSIKRGDRRK
jgi:hypothetical protein